MPFIISVQLLLVLLSLRGEMVSPLQRHNTKRVLPCPTILNDTTEVSRMGMEYWGIWMENWVDLYLTSLRSIAPFGFAVARSLSE